MESDEDDWDFEDGASPRSTPNKIQRQLEKERLEKEKKVWVKRARKTRHIYKYVPFRYCCLSICFYYVSANFVVGPQTNFTL